jgi:ion channel-forming bestrophin family protein
MLLNKPIPISYIFNKVKYDLLFVLLVSLIVVVLTDKYQNIMPEMPLTIPAFIGTAISILLSFKLNQSYDRWWEARKIWGAIVNDSRTLVLQLRSFLPAGNQEIIKKMGLRQVAWCYSLGQSLRGLSAIDDEDRFLSKEEIGAIEKHKNKALALLQLHTDDLKKLRDENQLDLFAHVHLDSTLVRLCESQGKAERIKNTVFPETYRIFLHATIYLFVITLSLALRVDGIFETPLLLAISAAFFLLEKSSTHMQDPFENRPTDTAMTTIAQNIEINIKQLLKETDLPNPSSSETFYSL